MSQPVIQKRIISIKEFRELYNIAPSTQAKYRKKYGLPHIKVCGTVRYHIEKVEEWMLSHTIEN